MRTLRVLPVPPLAVALLLGATAAYAAGEPAPGALSANTVRLPDGPGSVRGLADDLGVDGFSAQVRYDVPLDVPTARAGVAPSLALSYSGELGNGPVGVGWSFSIPAIRRSTRLGVPAFDASDELELVGIAGGGRLVALPDGTWRLEGKPYAVKVERAGEGFVVTANGGVHYLLGTSPASRQAEGTRVAAWHLEQLVHPTSERVVFTYVKDAGQVYLSEVRWGPADCYQAHLTYEERPDQAVSFRAGLRVQTAWRLKSVRVQSFGETLREYQLTYDDTLPLSRLASVRMVGRGGQGALPPLTFSYAPLQEATAQEIPGLSGWALNQLGVSLADIDGDGMTDLLRLDSQEGHSWRKGWGDRFGAPQAMSGPASASLQTSRLMDVDGDSRPELVLDDGTMWQLYGLAPDGWVSTGAWAGTEGVRLFDANLFFADLNGDGRVDVVRNASNALHVKWNRPEGLSAWEEKPTVGSTSAILGQNIRLQEVNGDGLSDVIEVTSDFVRVFLGRGDGTFVEEGLHFYPWAEAVADLSDLRFGDLNRDGLMDLVRLQAGNVQWYPGVAQGGFAPQARLFPQPTTGFSEPVVALADVNGNGSEDLVWSTLESTWRLDMAGATSAGMLVGIDNGLGKTVRVAYDASAVLSTVAEGAGNAWSVKLPVSIPVPTALEVSPGTDGPVRRVRYGVRDGFWDVEERRFAGFLFASTTTVGTGAEDTLVEEMLYHPGLGEDRELRGSVLEIRKRNGAGQLFTTELNTWEARAVEGVPDTALLRRPVQLASRLLHHEGVTQPLETRTAYVYDARGRIIEESVFGRLDVKGDESVIQRVYASDDATWVHDLLCEEKVFAAEQTTDAAGLPRLQRAALPSSHVRTFYGDAQTVLEWTDPAQCRVGRGLVRKHLAWLDAVPGQSQQARWVTQTEVHYDAWDNPVATLEGGVWRYLTYDAAGQFPLSESISPAEGRTLTWTVAEWDRVQGLQKRVTDANGVTVGMEYDTLGRPVSAALEGQQPHIRYAYDWVGPRPKTWTFIFDGRASELTDSWTGQWQPAGKWRESVSVTNGEGEPLYTATRLEGARWIVSGWKAYDSRGRMVTVGDSFYAPALPTALPQGTPLQTLSYDALGRVTRQTLPSGAVRTVAYRAFGATTTTEGLAPVTTRLDGLGRILRTERTVGGVVESVDAAYDVEDHVTAMSLNGGAVTHGFTYDTLGRMVHAVDPDVGPRTLEYNDFGWLTKHTNGAGQARTYEYDAGGRLVRAAGDGAAYVYHYDAPKPGTSGTHLSGRLAWVEEPRGEVQLSYDAFGRTVRHARWVDGRWAEELMEYSPSGLQLKGSVDGLVLEPTYDAAGRPVALGDYWRALQLDASGRVLAEAYGNGLTQSYSRDGLGLPSSITLARPGGQTLYGVTVGRNAWGAPTWVEDTDGVGLDHSATFAYDGAGRLVDVVLGAARQGSGPATGPGSFTVGPKSFRFTYAYDGLQNMTARTATGPKALDMYAGSFRYGERGMGPRQLTTAATAAGDVAITYDRAGRVLTLGGRTHTYNGLDQLVQVTVPAQGSMPARTVTHAYGYDGLRTVTEGDGSTQYWLTSNLVERDGRREWYLRQGDRTLVRLTLNPVGPITAQASISSPAVTAALDSGVRTGLSGLLASVIVAALGLAALAALKGNAARRLLAGVLLASFAGLACGGTDPDPDPDPGRNPLARWEIAKAIYFHGGIAAGPVLMTREDGTVFEERRYEPFGVPVDAYRENANGTWEVDEVDHRAEPLNALNKETDPTSGYSYHGARWLSPHLASWLTPDPPVKAPDAGFLEDPWALHPYQYVRQNPVLFWDPDGNAEKATTGQAVASFTWGAIKGFGIAVGSAALVGVAAGVAAPLGVAVGVGLLAYGVYGLVNGGAEKLADSGKRLWNGQGTSEDWDTFGQVVGGIAGGRFAKGSFNSGRTAGANLRAAVTNSPFYTAINQAVFWSGNTGGVGGAANAAKIAAARGGTTLEMLLEARGIKLPKWDASNSAVVKAWMDASRTFAASARGTVRAVVGKALRPGNVWETVELPALKANPLITKIIQVDPATHAETVIFTR